MRRFEWPGVDVRSLLCPLMLLCGATVLFSAPVLAQTETVDALWETYATQSDALVDLQQRCDEGNIEATTTNRICAQAVEAGFAFGETIEQLLALDITLPEADREALVDGLLTTRQVAASIMVDLGQCEEAVPILDALLAEDAVQARPIVAEAAARWRTNATVCITEQQTAAAARERALAEASATPDDAAQATETGRRSAGPVVMIATGGALAVGGFAWDLAMTGDRQTFTREFEDCRAGSGCDEAALNDAKQRIDSARVPIGVLVGTGAATAVGGVIWYAIDGRRQRDARTSVRITPARMSDGVERYYGVRLRARF